MNLRTHQLVVALAVVSITIAGAAAARGAGAGGKTSGWTISTSATNGNAYGSSGGGRSPATGGGKAKGGSVQGFDLPAATPGMAGMMMTPNGMIVHNTPAMAVAGPTNMGGSSLVAHMAPGVGNTTVTGATRGIGNSQGSGGTFDIAQMTHFGVSGMSMLGAMLGLGGSSLSSMLPKAAVAGSGTGAGGSTALSTIKSSMGLPTNNACSSPTGKKAGC